MSILYAAVLNDFEQAKEYPQIAFAQFTVDHIVCLADEEGWLKSKLVAYGVSTFYFKEIDKDSTMLTPKPQWKDILVQNTAGAGVALGLSKRIHTGWKYKLFQPIYDGSVGESGWNIAQTEHYFRDDKS